MTWNWFFWNGQRSSVYVAIKSFENQARGGMSQQRVGEQPLESSHIASALSVCDTATANRIAGQRGGMQSRKTRPGGLRRRLEGTHPRRVRVPRLRISDSLGVGQVAHRRAVGGGIDRCHLARSPTGA